MHMLSMLLEGADFAFFKCSWSVPSMVPCTRELVGLQLDLQGHRNRIWVRSSEEIPQLGNTWSKGTKRNRCVHEIKFCSQESVL